eukprot:m.472303 g.472303  ORF g.472303 m.472303 type:complete len:387 (-) comp32452_c0_seq1:50-1210(-)
MPPRLNSLWPVLTLVAAVALPRLLEPGIDQAGSLHGRHAVVTGGSRGAGRGFVHGLTEAGARVYVTGRNRDGVEKACAEAPGPGVCVPWVVDSANDTALKHFFDAVGKETGGRLDILVNNAFAGIGHWREHSLLGKPFWETGVDLFDAVHAVGVRSHFAATTFAMPLLAQASDRGLVVNTNSPGCLLYTLNVAYGMGKCAVDKMSADMAIEAATEAVGVVSWWPQEPLQTAEVLNGGLEGTTVRRGLPPLLGDAYAALGLRADALAHTALAGTVTWEGRVLAAFARDAGVTRSQYSGLALRTSQVAARYGVRDDRGIQPPPFLSIKWGLVAMVPPLRRWATIAPNAAASESQRAVFNWLPDLTVPMWVVKLVAGTPPTIQWPWLNP